jgi:hypothetical protein
MAKVSSGTGSKNAEPQQYDLVMLGSGAGGKLAAWTYGKQGKRVAVIERKYIGGACPNIACLPSKNIIHSAKAASYLDRAREFGIDLKGFAIDMAASVASLQSRGNLDPRLNSLWRRSSTQKQRFGNDFTIDSASLTMRRQLPPNFDREGTGIIQGRNGLDLIMRLLPKRYEHAAGSKKHEAADTSFRPEITYDD